MQTNDRASDALRIEPRYLDGSAASDFVLGDVLFKVAIGGDQRLLRTGADAVVLAKGFQFVQRELVELGDLRVERILEFGVQQGGSAALWALLFPLRRYVGIDIGDLDLPFPAAITSDPRFDAVRLKGRTRQEDRAAVRAIIDAEFDAPLDLVIDDASHQYHETVASFEVAFPSLRTGGAYIIEDWDWAHQPGPWNEPGHPWEGNPSLANVLFRLTMAVANRSDVVARVVVRPSVAVIFRGSARLDASFRLASLIGDRPAPDPI